MPHIVQQMDHIDLNESRCVVLACPEAIFYSPSLSLLGYIILIWLSELLPLKLLLVCEFTYFLKLCRKIPAELL